MLGIHDPWAVAAVSVGMGIALLVAVALVLFNRKALGALINNALARPVYLVRLKLKKINEWEQHRHSPMYIAAAKIHATVAEVEAFLMEQEPELELVS